MTLLLKRFVIRKCVSITQIRATQATIWKISVILPLVQSIYRENPHRSIFGDYGYGLTPYIIVPYKNPTTQEEITFYRILAKIRCLVERSFGVLKCRCIVLVHFNISIKSRNPI